MPKKQPKPFPWAAWLWVFAIANIAAGLLLSPATSIKHIRIEGANRTQARTIREAFEKFKGVPLLRVNLAKIVAELEAYGDIEQVKISANIFRRCVVKVTPRKPVAMVAQQHALFLDETGVLYVPSEKPPDVVTLQVPLGSTRPALNLFGNWSARDYAFLCREVKETLPKRGWIVAESRSGEVSLRGKFKAVVVLGNLKEIEPKLKKLKSIVEEEENILDTVISINVSVPEQPAVKRG